MASDTLRPSNERIRLWMAVRLARGEGFTANDVVAMGMSQRAFYRAIVELERVGLRIHREFVSGNGNRRVTLYRGLDFDRDQLAQLVA